MKPVHKIRRGNRSADNSFVCIAVFAKKVEIFLFNDRIIFVLFTLCSFMYKESIRPIETRFMVLLKLSFRRSTFIL